MALTKTVGVHSGFWMKNRFKNAVKRRLGCGSTGFKSDKTAQVHTHCATAITEKVSERR
jgi:hypothetical protein